MMRLETLLDRFLLHWSLTWSKQTGDYDFESALEQENIVTRSPMKCKEFDTYLVFDP